MKESEARRVKKEAEEEQKRLEKEQKEAEKAEKEQLKEKVEEERKVGEEKKQAEEMLPEAEVSCSLARHVSSRVLTLTVALHRPRSLPNPLRQLPPPNRRRRSISILRMFA